MVAMEVLKGLKSKTKFEKTIVYPWPRILRIILGDSEHREYTCLACRKSMFKAAEIVCRREGATGIVTGESLGQKATQTLSNLGATTHGIKFPILRPLLGLDKIEIERLSKKLGIWHDVHAGCCYAVPKHPRTRADSEVLDKLLDELHIEDAISKEHENILEVRTFEEDFKGYLETLA